MVELAFTARVRTGSTAKAMAITEAGTMPTTNVRTMSAVTTAPTVVAASESVRCIRQTAKRKDGS
jgi:hypothetical protein